MKDPAGLGAGYYYAQLSADGKTIAALDGFDGNLWLSTDTGATWTMKDPAGSGYYDLLILSGDGKTIAVSGGDNYGLWLSHDGGATWGNSPLTVSMPMEWYEWGVQMSSDGKVRVVFNSSYRDGFWISTDSGITWTLKDPSGTGYYNYVNMSANGSSLEAGEFNEDVCWFSKDGGGTWTSKDKVYSVFSEDGSVIAGLNAENHGILLSKNGGDSWTTINPSGKTETNYYPPAISADAKTIAVTGYLDDGFALWLSKDSGVTWNQKAWSQKGEWAGWSSIWLSSDGSTIVLWNEMNYDNTVWLSHDDGVTWYTTTLPGTFSGVSLSSNGQTIAIDYYDFNSEVAGSEISYDGGATWTTLPFMNVQISGDGEIIFGMTSANSMVISRDNGYTWNYDVMPANYYSGYGYLSCQMSQDGSSVLAVPREYGFLMQGAVVKYFDVTFQTDGTVGSAVVGDTAQFVREGTDADSVFALAPYGWRFLKWTLAGADYSTDNPLTVKKVAAAMALTAVFTVQTYTVTFQTDGTPGASLEGVASQVVEIGKNASPVKAVAPAGWHFLKWTLLDLDYSQYNPLTVLSVSSNLTMTAKFELMPPLTVVSGTGSGDYIPGTVVSIEANPPLEKMVFERWDGDYSILADRYAFSTTAIMPSKAATVMAVYRSQQALMFTLSVVDGAGSGPYSEGSVVGIVSVAAPSGKVFNGWRGAKVADPLAAATTLVMPSANITVTATYRNSGDQAFKLDVVNGVGSGIYVVGETVVIFADPAMDGMVFTGWTGAQVADSGLSETTLVMPAADTTVTANFSQIGWTPVVSFTSNHSESAKGSQDSYSVAATFTFPKDAVVTPLKLLNLESWVGIRLGGFRFDAQIKDAAKQKITDKSGTATFITEDNDTVSYKWDAKKITVSVKSKLPIDAAVNILDLIGYEPGKYSETLDDCAMNFGDAVWAAGIPWTATVKVDSKGFFSWTAKGK